MANISRILIANRGEIAVRIIKEFLGLPGLGLEAKKKIMWENCRRLYGFAA